MSQPTAKFRCIWPEVCLDIKVEIAIVGIDWRLSDFDIGAALLVDQRSLEGYMARRYFNKDVQAC